MMHLLIASFRHEVRKGVYENDFYAGDPLPSVVERRVGVQWSAFYKMHDGQPVQQQIIGQLLMQYHDLVKMCEDQLTPGGSEFFGNPENCIQFAHERLGTTATIALERNQLRVEVQRLESLL